MTWKYKLRGDDLSKELKALEKTMRQEILIKANRAGLQQFEREAKARASRLGGEAAADVESTVTRTRNGGAVGTVGPRGKKFPIKAFASHEYGSGLYGSTKQEYIKITPRSASVLKFTVRGGATIFRPMVKHPGVHPTPVMRPTWDRKKKQAAAQGAAILALEIEKVVKR